jgi:hypothetical protein
VRLSVFRRPFHNIYIAEHAEQGFTWVRDESVTGSERAVNKAHTSTLVLVTGQYP